MNDEKIVIAVIKGAVILAISFMVMCVCLAYFSKNNNPDLEKRVEKIELKLSEMEKKPK